jgi:pimeloyl-ACP methyl ester carboxylesterase
LKLHYTMGGHGPAVVLLHGFAETSRMWTPIVPVLGREIYGNRARLARNWGLLDPGKRDQHEGCGNQHSLAGAGTRRPIGLVVAYAYAAQFPAEAEKLAVMDAFLPGVEGWEPIYNHPSIWHFRFNGPPDVSKSTFRFFGTTWPRTRTARSPRPTARPISKPIRDLGE